MNMFTKFLGLLVVFATALSTYQPVQASAIRPPVLSNYTGEGVVVDVRRRRYYRGRRHRNRRAGAIALGVLGGAIIGSAITRDRYRHRYYDDGYYRYRRPRYYRPRVYYEPRPIYRERRYRRRRDSAHTRWCYRRYRSYQARSDTFVAYSGRVKRCRSPYR